MARKNRKGRFFVDERKMRKRAEQICQEIGADVPLNVPVEQLSPAQQQMIEIIRAVAHEPKVLILDEPTASLGNAEVKILFDVMRKLKKSGVSILIITHKLDEVLEISDTISIMRDGVACGNGAKRQRRPDGHCPDDAGQGRLRAVSPGREYSRLRSGCLRWKASATRRGESAAYRST